MAQTTQPPVSFGTVFSPRAASNPNNEMQREGSDVQLRERREVPLRESFLPLSRLGGVSSWVQEQAPQPCAPLCQVAEPIVGVLLTQDVER